jgi:hypothetical protein
VLVLGLLLHVPSLAVIGGGCSPVRLLGSFVIDSWFW